MILSPSDYDSIRKAIDTKLTVHDVPDDILLMPQYLPLAESQINRITGNATVTDEIKAATILLAASFLARSVNLWTSLSIQSRDQNITVPARTNLATELKQSSDQILKNAGYDLETTLEVDVVPIVYEDAYA